MKSEHVPRTRRQPHRKSRGGCVECKKRHIKCGEEKPSCRSCVIRSLRCIYKHRGQSPEPPWKSTAPKQRGDTLLGYGSSLSPLPSDGHESSGASPQYSHAAEEFGLRDLGLLHHWTVKTSLMIFDCPAVNNCWSVVFPKLGLGHPFVMYAILSLASLHLASSKPWDKESHLLAAAAYHDTGLQVFQEAAQRMDDDSCDALFAFSILNIIYTFATFGPLLRHCDAASRTSRTLDLHWMRLIRGVHAVLRPIYERVRKGPLQNFTITGNLEDIDPELESIAGDNHLLQIRTSYENANASDVELYDSTLTLLRRCRCYMARFGDTSDDQLHGLNQHWTGPFIFLHCVSDAYIDKLHQRQPPALLIFSFFGALLSAHDNTWFMDGWAMSIVSAVDDILGSYWAPYTEWCRETVAMTFVKWENAC